jgi:hypothetical protein
MLMIVNDRMPVAKAVRGLRPTDRFGRVGGDEQMARWITPTIITDTDDRHIRFHIYLGAEDPLTPVFEEGSQSRCKYHLSTSAR